MKLWRTPPVDPRIAVLLDQNQALIAQNIALVERLGKLVGQLARAEPANGVTPLRSVTGGRGGPLPNYSPEFWRSDDAAEVTNEGTVVLDQEAVDAAERELKESFRASLREGR